MNEKFTRNEFEGKKNRIKSLEKDLNSDSEKINLMKDSIQDLIGKNDFGDDFLNLARNLKSKSEILTTIEKVEGGFSEYKERLHEHALEENESRKGVEGLKKELKEAVDISDYNRIIEISNEIKEILNNDSE